MRKLLRTTKLRIVSLTVWLVLAVLVIFLFWSRK